MLLEGSYLGDVEKVLESFRLIRREMIRGGEINVIKSTLPFIQPCCHANDLSAFNLIFDTLVTLHSPQINDRVLQNILVAATLPSYGLRSIEKYIEKRFPLVNISLTAIEDIIICAVQLM
jgi:hypothetical protein